MKTWLLSKKIESFEDEITQNYQSNFNMMFTLFKHIAKTNDVLVNDWKRVWPLTQNWIVFWSEHWKSMDGKS